MSIPEVTVVCRLLYISVINMRCKNKLPDYSEKQSPFSLAEGDGLK